MLLTWNKQNSNVGHRDHNGVMVHVQEGHMGLLFAQNEEQRVSHIKHLEQEVCVGHVQLFVSGLGGGEVYRLARVGKIRPFRKQIDLEDKQRFILISGFKWT